MFQVDWSSNEIVNGADKAMMTTPGSSEEVDRK